MINFFVLSFFFLCAFEAFSLEPKELPEPLTFKDTITFANNKFHHTFLNAQSGIDAAKAIVLSTDAANDVSISLKGYLRKVGVSHLLSDRDKDNDSKISLIAKKNIYDFGLSSSREKHAHLLLQSKIIEYRLKHEQYINKVVAAYLNILRADNDFLIQNEAMSIAFVRFKRQQDNAEFGLSSDIDILKAQSHYQSVRQKRYFSEIKQRFSRQYFAELLGSSNLPDQIEVPNFNRQVKLIDDVDIIMNLTLNNSNEIQLNLARLRAAKQALKTAAHTPLNIEAELEVSDYQRESAFRDDWRASINFNIPLYMGDRTNSAVLIAKAKHKETLAKLDESRSAIKIKVLELWQEIKQKNVELEGAIIKQEYRDLYLERSRADYELEYKSDLGDAMVEFTRSRAQRFDIEYDLEIAWHQLTALVGKKNYNKLLKQFNE